MELGPKDHPYYGFGDPNSIIAVYMDPLGNGFLCISSCNYSKEPNEWKNMLSLPMSTAGFDRRGKVTAVHNMW